MLRLGLVTVVSLALVAGAHGSAAGVDVVVKIKVGAQPCSVAMAAGSAWATIFGDDQVVRIDPATNTVIRRIAVGGGPCGITVGAGSLWLMNFGANTVQRIDAATSSVTATIPVGIQPYDVAFGFGSVWVTNAGEGTVFRINPATNRVVRRIRVGGGPGGLAVFALRGLGRQPLAALDRSNQPGAEPRCQARAARSQARVACGQGRQRLHPRRGNPLQGWSYARRKPILRAEKRGGCGTP